MADKLALVVDIGELRQIDEGDRLVAANFAEAVVTGGVPLEFVSGDDGNVVTVGGSYIGAISMIPAGGSTGQVLTKRDGTDYNAYWADVVTPA